MTVRVVLVDDQELVRAGFAKLLDGEPNIEVVGQAATGTEALDLCARHRVDVVLMDIRMPQMDGIEATRRLRSTPGGPKVLILTTFDRDEYVFEALKAGAAGFLLKDAHPDQLIAAVEVVARGDSLLSAGVTRRLIETFVRYPPPSTESPSGLDVLTPREVEILALMARGLSNRDVAERLVLGETTVKSHVGSIFVKLGLRDRTQAVIAAYESGLVRPGEASAPNSDAR